VGSIKVGKDADVVLWTANPLSVYAKAEKTIVDGTIYYDLEKDVQLRKQLMMERNRLIQKMITAKKDGAKTTPAVVTFDEQNECELDHHVKNSVLDIQQNISSN
jgi:urease alpha subunit